MKELPQKINSKTLILSLLAQQAQTIVTLEKQLIMLSSMVQEIVSSDLSLDQMKELALSFAENYTAESQGWVDSLTEQSQRLNEATLSHLTGEDFTLEKK